MAYIPGSLEALLFIYGEPLSREKAATLLGVSREELDGAVTALRAQHEAGGGLALLEYEGSLQLVTKPAFGKLLEHVFKAEIRESLTPAALETLSIITYASPIGRAEIDYIRGVNSTFSIRALLLRGLVSRENDPTRANAFRYKPSVELLQHLGVMSITDLPDYEKFRTLVARIKPAETPAPSQPTT